MEHLFPSSFFLCSRVVVLVVDSYIVLDVFVSDRLVETHLKLGDVNVYKR